MDASTQKKKNKKLKIWTAVAFVLIFAGLMVFLFSGDNLVILKELFQEDITKKEVRESLSALGIKGYITMGILSMLQVVFTFLPAEPVQVMAGVSFGFWVGGLVCLVGVFVGNTIIYILYKIYGQRLTEYFESNAEFDFESARRSAKITLIIFILYFLPAIPYGLICFFTASLNVKYPKYILLTTLGAIPSILIGVGLGHMAIASSWIVSLLVFIVLLALLMILFKNKSKVFQKVNAFMQKKEKKSNGLRKPNGFVLSLLLFGSRFVFDTKIKVRLKNNVGKLERPAIVLCPHGSFIDFVYAARVLKKEKPNFITARLYFYHKWLGRLLKYLGCLPKSMFASDLENAKDCMRVLSSKSVLVMMPEARLSTVGKFESIQESTYKFIHRANAAVYYMQLKGDYLANPKWGDGARRGAFVEAELNPLFAAGEAKELSLEELQTRIDSALYYDEFKWLESKPEVAYKSKTLAEGLENILYRCPKCGGICTFKAEGRTLTCEVCGLQAELNDRYAFEKGMPFENFAVWYEWQVEQTKGEILQENYRLESKVELRHASVDGKSLTRHAGDGVCVLDKTGLTYKGTRDGEDIEKFFPLSQIYRLLFGAGVDFEIYEGKEIWFFVPEEKRSAVIWYVVSGLLKDVYKE